MNNLTENGKMLMNSLGVTRDISTQQLVFDILSLQGSIAPYTDLGSREIRWQVAHKKKQGGYLNLTKLKNRFFSSKNP